MGYRVVDVHSNTNANHMMKWFERPMEIENKIYVLHTKNETTTTWWRVHFWRAYFWIYWRQTCDYFGFIIRLTFCRSTLVPVVLKLKLKNRTRMNSPLQNGSRRTFLPRRQSFSITTWNISPVSVNFMALPLRLSNRLTHLIEYLQRRKHWMHWCHRNMPRASSVCFHPVKLRSIF